MQQSTEISKMSDSYILRYQSPLGRYPKIGLSHENSHLFVQPDLIFTATKILEGDALGLSDEHNSEFEYLRLEEIRLLASVMLSSNPDSGMIYWLCSRLT